MGPEGLPAMLLSSSLCLLSSFPSKHLIVCTYEASILPAPVNLSLASKSAYTYLRVQKLRHLLTDSTVNIMDPKGWTAIIPQEAWREFLMNIELSIAWVSSALHATHF